ncbi:MAG: hypothetical protein A3C30_00695 [Candidatus Levybacteria bacterium RIFCSPHIGHO2_02_FULL_40_18]|nr:MAG: hypothetical protein A2869_03235 [Candidatus Levybacteria bacterium RIFCSPHIGHO2_01_FULL_40_58]OGH27219.1 MAG: hypothetical protein A3C30_00695 [Candidatus Levybacteria bacterium RIFCSPHIGHO2_02_FULL_40_18]OGH31078.1 MAG: hypothetical protein A3E43_05110 [Candidatus Levybacteria bacterium RIFCSPHIGHO2_12_FULL_40_31]OGH40754.1 MAG: hypothetical protein A2894_03330 [Candidatus Levybacteria bacterium RIFCSPLOWO2_01_FULL_40_64]OGH49392.1 MAG: hypothetical protein A3I54_01970 [Candidatus Lev
MIEFIKKLWPQIIIVLIVVVFFWQFFLKGLLPIPSDTIVGLYHPYLDYYAKVSPQGVPFKNFLITDPVRQIIPWKMLAIDNLSNLTLPLWNPYEMAGKPLLANFQSGIFYPLNLLLLIKPYFISWTIFIIIAPLLSGIFTFAFLKNLKLDVRACLFGAITFAFGGFSIAWLEWGNIGHVALWLPLILLSIDKIMSQKISNFKWGLVFLFSLVSSFFAGHLQIFFYVFIVSIAYLVFRWLEHGRKFRTAVLFTIYFLLFAIATAVQWIPALQFINLSARSTDQNPLTAEGWFIPWQHLVQFIAPDFFGNPATLNYWGVWNYAEFVGYIGIVGLFLAFCSIFLRRAREVVFFTGAIIVSLLFSLPTFLAKLPFDLSIPFLSSAQPTRLILLITFSLSVLSAFGFDYLIMDKKINRKALIGLGIIFITLFFVAWAVVFSKIDLGITSENLAVAKRNLIFPSGILAGGMLLILGIIFVKETMARTLLIFLLLALSFYDLYRFGGKFTSFTPQEYYYPQTSAIEFLQKDKSIFRIASNDSRIFPPNFSTYYKIQSIEGYDPLYLLSYAELIAASEREDHSIHMPFGFNRIITPHNLDSNIIDLLNVKYVLSLSDINSNKFQKVFQEGQTRIYENANAFPRVFFVERLIRSGNKTTTIQGLFKDNLHETAYVESEEIKNVRLTKGEAKVTGYNENRVEIETENSGEGFLVLSDTFYPSWKAEVDGSNTKIYKTNYAFRGVFIPKGKHRVVFYDTLF